MKRIDFFRNQGGQYLLRHPFLMGWLKKIIFNKIVVNSAPFRHYTLSSARRHAARFPHRIEAVEIETILNCNAKCIMCYHSKANLSGVMSEPLFKKIIDECARNNVGSVGLSIYGEPLLDPQLRERIEYLRKYQMAYGFYTNGSLLNPEIAEMLFELGGLRKINFSVCGLEPVVYEKIMVGLRRDTSYRNILHFLSLKEKLKKKDLLVVISTVDLNLNKGERKAFVRFWQRQKGVDYVIIADLWDRVGKALPEDIGKLQNLHRLDNWRGPCSPLWGPIYVYFDGRVAPCCDDSDLRELIIGDFNTQSLREIYNGNELSALRKIHLENKRANHPVCGRCAHNCLWF